MWTPVLLFDELNLQTRVQRRLWILINGRKKAATGRSGDGKKTVVKNTELTF